jgi:hypothetical protein
MPAARFDGKTSKKAGKREQADEKTNIPDRRVRNGDRVIVERLRIQQIQDL